MNDEREDPFSGIRKVHTAGEKLAYLACVVAVFIVTLGIFIAHQPQEEKCLALLNLYDIAIIAGDVKVADEQIKLLRGENCQLPPDGRQEEHP